MDIVIGGTQEADTSHVLVSPYNYWVAVYVKIIGCDTKTLGYEISMSLNGTAPSSRDVRMGQGNVYFNGRQVFSRRAYDYVRIGDSLGSVRGGIVNPVSYPTQRYVIIPLMCEFSINSYVSFQSKLNINVVVDRYKLKLYIDSNKMNNVYWNGTKVSKVYMNGTQL